MRYLSTPGAVLVFSLLLFSVTWAVAPGHLLSRIPTVEVVAPTAREVTADEPSAPSTVRAVGLTNRPVTVYGFSRPYEVALTFDDGPHPVHTAKLLDILDKYHIRATFFVNGYWLDTGRILGLKSREVLLRAARTGHTIGNHTYNHRLLSKLSPQEQTWEIVANELLLTEVLGQRPLLFRPPYGKMTRHATEVIKQYGYVETMWNVTAADEIHRQPTEIASGVMRWLHRHKGGIVLLHDRVRSSVDAVNIILRRLQTENCRRKSSGLPRYRIVGLDAFLRSPAESLALAGQSGGERHKSSLLSCPAGHR